MKGIYRGWWQAGVALLLQAISAASIFTSYSLIAAPLKAEFEPSNMVLMLGITVVTLMSGILSPALGKAVDRKSIRNLMVLGASLLSAGFLLLSFVTSMVQAVVVYALCMSASTVLLGPMTSAALLARWFNRRRGLAMGLASSGGAFGGLLLPPLLQALIDGFEWRAALQIYAVLALLVAVPLILILVKDRPSADESHVENITETASEGNALSRGAASQGPFLKDPRFWLIALIMGSLFGGGVGLISNMVQLAGTKGVEPSQTALLLSISSAATFGAKLVWSTIIDRLKLTLALAAMLVIQGIAVAVFVISGNFIGLVAAIVTAGLAAGGVVPAWSLTLSRLYGAARLGQAMGMMTFLIMPWTMLSPPLFGWAYDVSGTYNVGLLAYLALLAMVLVGLTQLRIQPPSDGG